MKTSLPAARNHKFSQVPAAEIPRSAFDRPYARKMTFDADYLVPYFVDEVLPGDTFNFDATLAVRILSPLHTPIMDNLYLDTFYFAVPLRLVWDNFEKFMGAQTDPDDPTDYLTPQIVAPASTGWAVGTLSDFFGLPTGIVGTSVLSFYHRAYNLIYNEWFRDQNLQDSVVVDKDDGPDTNADYALLKRGKRHDYFTSCLPWPQKGPGVELPLSGNAPVIGLGTTGDVSIGTNLANIRETEGATLTYPFYFSNPGHTFFRASTGVGTTARPMLYAELSDVAAASINSLRQAFQLQKLYERDARGGTRYTELIKAHFGVTSPDARLQRPEFLGGRSTPISIHQVEQTAPPTEDAAGGTPQGNLAAWGAAISNREGFTKSFVEHSVIIGLVSVRADLTYQQGLPRAFSRRTRVDYYWPAFATIGEQAVLNQEIYAVAEPNVQNQAVFGYQERFAEYRYKANEICGKLRSTYSTPLDMWHLAQEFSALPELDAAFIQEAVPMERVIAVTDEPDFIFDSNVKIRTVRPMPLYGVPGNVDRF